MMDDTGMGICAECNEEKELNEDGVCAACAKQNGESEMGGMNMGMEDEE